MQLKNKRHYNMFGSLILSLGNMIFTLMVVGTVLYTQSVGAIFLEETAVPSVSVPVPYQAYLTDEEDIPLTGTYNMKFCLYDSVTGGIQLWCEEWTGTNAVQLTNGLFNVSLGSLNAISPSVTANGSLFLGVTIGTEGELAPRTQIGSSVYATHAWTVPDGSITSGKLKPSYGKVCLSEEKRLTFPGGGYTPLDMPELTLDFTVDHPSVVFVWVKGLMSLNSPTVHDTGVVLRMDGPTSAIARYSNIDGLPEQFSVHDLIDVDAGSHTLSVTPYSNQAATMVITGSGGHKACLYYVVLGQSN